MVRALRFHSQGVRVQSLVGELRFHIPLGAAKIIIIKRNEIGSFIETWMDLQTVIQSEVRKTNIMY